VSAGALDEALVRATLNEIVDPCSAAAGAPAGLDDMGLVRSVEVAERDGRVTVSVRIGVTEPGCFMIYPFAREARQRLGELEASRSTSPTAANGCPATCRSATGSCSPSGGSAGRRSSPRPRAVAPLSLWIDLDHTIV
jgi:metal-sulfur cluster biosynthetic enzyme